MAGGLPPAPRWAWVAMVVGLVATALLAYRLLNRPSPPTFAAAAAALTSEQSATPSSASTSPSQETPADEPARVLVVGDGYTTGSPPNDSAHWPDLLDRALDDAGLTVAVDVAAADGSGYAIAGTDGARFADLVGGTDGRYDVVVFFGSHSDNASAGDVQSAAEATFREAEHASPRAEMIAIGPSWVSEDPPGYILTNRDAVAAAAEAEGVEFVDPLTERWFGGDDDEALLGADGRHPTDQGQRYLADKIRPLLESALSALNR